MSTGLKLAKIGWKSIGMKLRLRDLGFDISLADVVGATPSSNPNKE